MDTSYGPLSVPIIGVWFLHPYHEFPGVPPDIILTMSLDLNFSPWEKKRFLTARIKKNVLAMF